MLSIVKLDVKKKQGVADETQGTSQDVPGFPPVFHTPSNIPTQAKGRLEWATRWSCPSDRNQYLLAAQRQLRPTVLGGACFQPISQQFMAQIGFVRGNGFRDAR